MSISKEAIEAAARAIYDVRDDPYDDDEWEEMDSTDREECMCQARAALTSAAPLIAAEAVRAELMEVASLLEPFSGIGLANGATRNDVANWVRARALAIEGEAE